MSTEGVCLDRMGIINQSALPLTAACLPAPRHPPGFRDAASALVPWRARAVETAAPARPPARDSRRARALLPPSLFQ